MRTLRLLHAMPRCGSTLMAAHLASMPHIVLLSEIHPSHLVSHPCDQALCWHDLITPEESNAWAENLSLAEILARIHDRAAEINKTLVVREWSYRDFKYAEPERSSLPPSQWSSLARHCILPWFDEVLRASLVREPVDQWLSFQKFNARTDRKNPDDLESCMRSYREFAAMASTTKNFRFEDFVRRPNDTLEQLCSTLRLPYSDVGDAWKTCTKITGDPVHMRSHSSVEVLPRRDVDDEILTKLRATPDYLETCRLLNYPVR